MDDIVYIVNHVFMPLKLPQEDDRSTIREHALADLVAESSARYYARGAQPPSIPSSTVTKLLSGLAQLYDEEDDYTAEAVVDRLADMKTGDIAAFLIREQNAGLIFRVRLDDVICESFEVSAANTAVMTCEDRLVRTFPGPCTCVPREVFESHYFRNELATFVNEMNQEMLEGSAAQARKAGTDIAEIRDTAHPRYITDLLMAILLATGGTSNTFVPPARTIQKRVADDVLWQNAYAPWRRSQLWMVIRVVLQTSLSDIEYKSLLLFIVASIARHAIELPDAFDNSVLDCMRKKIGRRAAKLCALDPNVVASFVIEEAQQVCEDVTSELSRRWKTAQEVAKPSYSLLWTPSTLKSLDIDGDTYLQLTNSSPVIRAALDNAESSAGVEITYAPHPLIRFNSRSVDNVIRKRLLKKVLINNNHSTPWIPLFDFEVMVSGQLASWAAESRTEGLLPDLVQAMQDYFAVANKQYAGNAEGQSIMILTILELWMAIDRMATRSIPLLLSYPPEIPITLIEPLLLRSQSELKRARTLTTYLNQRQSRSAYQPSVFGRPTQNSFAVQYFDSSRSLKKKKTDIESKAQAKKDRKEDRLQQLIAELNVWKRTPHDPLCNGTPSSCRKCSTKKPAEWISVEEWPLPTAEHLAKYVIFEMYAPMAFVQWREATYSILFDWFTPIGSSIGTQQQVPVYEQLAPYMKASVAVNLVPHRITLGSTKKCWKRSHYSGKKLPTTVGAVCTENALEWCLYDTKSGRLINHRFFAASVRSRCTLRISGDVAYEGLQWALDGVDHEENAVVARQGERPRDLSPHEFIAFGCLRAGAHVQWMNIARAIAARTLSFRSPSVHTLISQAIQQVGPFVDSNPHPLWHEDLASNSFCTTLLSSARSLLNGCRNNWQEVATLQTIITISARILADTRVPLLMATNALDLLHQCREVTYTWITALVSDLPSLAEAHVSARKETIRQVAATCCLTLDADRIVICADDWSMLISCLMILHDHRNVDDDVESNSASHVTLSRVRRLIHRLQRQLCDTIILTPAILDQAISRIWSTYNPSTPWSTVPSHDHWLHAKASAGNQTHVQDVHFNAQSGAFLVGGKTIGNLPAEITEHAIYRRLFNQTVLRVVPAGINGFDYKSISLVSGHEVFFAMKNGDLLINSVEPKTGKRFRYIPHEVFAGDLPMPLVGDFAHWLDLSTLEIDFRSISNPWMSTPHSWCLELSNRRAERIDKDGHRHVLVSPQSETSNIISERLQVMDDTSHLVVTVQGTVVDAYFQRLQLAFQVDLSSEFPLLESKTYPGFAVDEDQDLGTLVGLHSKLILRDISPSDVRLPRRVLVPYGRIRVTQSQDQTNVLIATDVDHSSVLHTQFVVNQDLGILVGDGTLKCHFFQILLHAVTGQPLPDPLTGRTGTAQALNQLASSFSTSFQTLGSSERTLLQQIRHLTPRRVFYPQHLTSMQTVQWSNRLPAFTQRAAYEVLVRQILDYDATLHHIFHNGEKDANETVQYDVGLLTRAISRESSITDLITVSIPTPRDKIYMPRHSKQLQDILHYKTGLMITGPDPAREQRSPPPTGHLYHLFEEIEAESLSVPLPSVNLYPPASMSMAWLSDPPGKKDIAEDWFAWYQWCRSVRPSLEARYLLLFRLCAQAYMTRTSTISTPLLPYMLKFVMHADVLPPIPSWTSYNLQCGRSPSPADIAAIVAKAVYPLEHTPSGAFAQGPWYTSWDEDDTSREDHYREALREGSLLLQEELMDLWRLSPSAIAVSVDHTTHLYFDVQAITAETTNLFAACRRNNDLYLFLNRIECMLPLSSKNSASIIPAPLITLPLPEEVRKDCGIPSLTQLLPTSCSSWSSDRTYQPSISSSPLSGQLTNPVEVTELRDILNTLAASSAQLQRVYSGGVSQSVDSLQSKVEHAPPCIPSFTLLHKHYLDSRDNCDTLLSHIRSVLQPTTPGQVVLAASGLWPAIDPRSILLQLSKDNWRHVPSEWKDLITEFGATFIYTQQLTRMVQYTVSGQMTDLIRELENCDFVDPKRARRHPDWFLIQIENNFRARPLQLDVADEMYSPQDGRNITLQLNMGEGKTAVIVPMVVSSLADGDRLVRVIVLKPLAPQMFQLLRERVSMFCNRRIFYLPFSRQLKLNASRLSMLYELYETCRRTGGILVTQPEHALSVRLLAVEKMITQDSANDAERIHAVRLHQLLAKNARDILDESDELLHTRYQLIYTMGAQQDLQCSPNRWLVMQDVLLLAGKHVETLLKGYGVGSGIEVQRPNVWAFPLVKLPESFGDELIGKVVVDVMEGQRVRGLNMLFIPSEHAHIIRDFITHRIPRDSILSAVQQLFEPDPMFYNVLLLLRGLFVEGLLVHVLCQPRWRVDYGLVEETRSLLAVPYRAKDVPSPRSEFGHPDIAILLTCLAYYYKGLDEEQLKACLNRLLLDSNPVMLYESWIVDIPLDILPISLRHVSGINLNDTAQFAFLYDIFRYCRAVIDFYLARAVFPRAMKEFPDKLSSSGWDLAERRVHPTTGFSGTNDNQLLLPTSITQVDPVDQSSTNALVLTYLLRPENAEYTCTRDATSGRTMSGQQLVSLLAVRQEVRAFLDVGAQMLDLSNHNVATQWLAEREDIDAVQAAIYFNDKDELMVVRRNGDLELLQSSVYRDRLWSCLVYLDDAHTRGTDLKMPREWRAAVTIGKKVTKDRLVQGCMRMRQLGKGQSLSFLAPPDVDTLIRNSRPSPSDSAISVADIVHWTMLSTCIDITHHAPQWAQQGTDFLARSSSLQSMSTHLTSMQQQNLRSMWLQRESRTLTELYGVKASTIPVDTHPKLVERLRELGLQAVYSRNVDEEQEREISLEVEAEQQREHPGAPQVAKHRFDPKLRAFAMRGLSADLDSLAISPLVVVKPILDRHLPRKDPFSKKFRVTRDFAVTVQGADNGTNFLKDVQWVLRDNKGNLLVISQFEANSLVPILRGQWAKPQVFLHIYSPRVTRDGYRFDRFAFHSVPTAPDPPPTYSALSQFNIFAGQLYPSTYQEYICLCNWLGISTSMGSRAQPDGFVLPKNRGDLLEILLYCVFQQSPVGLVRELLNVRRKRQDFSLTPLGKMLHAQAVRPVDVERAQ